mgnify:CR=1 FL=1
MGQTLNYEIGQLNIGRRVKVYGTGAKQHGMGAKLVAAHPKEAEVLIDNHGQRPERFDWQNIRDWTSQNPNPLNLPAVKATPIVKVTPTPIMVAPPAPPKDPFAVFAGLSQEIPAAMQAIAEAEEEVDTATEMLQQAEARHKRAKQGLVDIKAAIDAARAMIDKVTA